MQVNSGDKLGTSVSSLVLAVGTCSLGPGCLLLAMVNVIAVYMRPDWTTCTSRAETHEHVVYPMSCIHKSLGRSHIALMLKQSRCCAFTLQIPLLQ